eukprot:6214446-Amphidinium_carterae.1
MELTSNHANHSGIGNLTIRWTRTLKRFEAVKLMFAQFTFGESRLLHGLQTYCSQCLQWSSLNTKSLDVRRADNNRITESKSSFSRQLGKSNATASI